MKIKTKWLILLALAFLTQILYGSWFDSFPSQITQPDGTMVNVFLTGDEYYITAHDEAGYTIIQDEATGYWCWAEPSGDNIISSGLPIHQHSPNSRGIPTKANISEAKYSELREPFDREFRTRTVRTPSVGVIENLVVFIRFQGETEFPTTGLTTYNAMFNDIGEGIDSLHQYYWDASYNQLEVYSPFFPEPVNNTIVSYEDSHPRAYFQPYNASTNPTGYTGGPNGGQRTAREHQLLADAIAFIESDVPPNLSIDSDNDNYVDNVCFVVRGGTDGWSELLWPHRWSLYTRTAYLHGKRVWDYNLNVENHMQQSGVSVLAHEFGHSLGAPDYYRYNYDGNPVWRWDLMANNTTPPQSMSAWTKWKYMHWVDELPYITENGVYTLRPNTLYEDVLGYRIASPNSNTESFVVEYRSTSTGLIDSALPGSGLLIYRVRPSINGNSEGPPDELYVYRPNGSPTSDGQMTSAHFSADVGRTLFSDNTNPSPFLSNGAPGGIIIANIGSAGETISFEFIDFNLNVTPGFIDFADMAVNSTASQTVTIMNNKDVPVEVYSAAISGVDFIDFRVIDSGYSVILEPGESTDYEIVFQPLTTGTKTAFLEIYHDFGEDAQMVYLTGMGLTAVSAFPYMQSFNDTPANWVRKVGLFTEDPSPEIYESTNWTTNNLQWFLGAFGNDDSHINGQGARANIYGTDSRAWLITPPIIMPATNTLELSFDLSFTAWSAIEPDLSGWDDRFIVAVSADDGRTWLPENILALWDNAGSEWVYNDISVQGETITFSLEGYSGIIRIAFYGESTVNNADNYIHIDNIRVGEPASDTDATLVIPTFALQNNYPNPFNPETTIAFSLPQTGAARLTVYNVKGQKVRTLLHDVMVAGEHRIVWNGQDDANHTVGSGVYFYRLEAGGKVATRKMVLVK